MDLINFQSSGAAVPDGYSADLGAAYSDEVGYGWVTQASAGSANPTPIEMTEFGRDRNRINDQKLDTLMHMQPFGAEPAAWEHAVENGSYDVTVSVGDPRYFDSTHVLNIEGDAVISPFEPSASEPFALGTATVEVTDGKLTVDALGGSNTKINYIEFAETDDSPSQPAGDPEIEIENLDGIPYSDRLVFSRIGNDLANPPTNGVHDEVTLRIENTGSDPLQIAGLPITGPWELVDDVALPTTIAAGGQLDLPVLFTATSGTNGRDIKNGTLTIQSNDADEPNTVVQLAGFWQRRSEGGKGSQEPTIEDMVEVFGYTTEITGPGQELNQQGLVQAVGEEVLSPYWQRADSSEPVEVRQLAAYHSYPATARVFWHAKESNTTNRIITHEPEDGQSLLPRKINSDDPAQGTFNPNGTFGFKIDPEWSDPNKNNQQVDLDNGSPGPAGHHVRFWPVRDRQGEIVEDTYIMVMDYSGINYDYNDNVYLVSNVEPEPREALYRIDVGSDSNYTDSNGNLWSSDEGLFTPAGDAIDQETQANEFANTEDDLLYKTFRGRLESDPVQDQRVLTYDLPIDTPDEVDVRLHFAEPFWGLNDRPGVGQRVFDVRVEGETVMDDFDIVAEATGALNATVVQIGGVEVNDGLLTLEFDPETDYVALAAIEVLQPIG